MSEQNLTFKRAFDLAQGHESAAKDIATLRGSTQYHEVHKLQASSTLYYRCGKPGHRQESYKLKTSTCHYCGKLGHIKSICRSRLSPRTPPAPRTSSFCPHRSSYLSSRPSYRRSTDTTPTEHHRSFNRSTRTNSYDINAVRVYSNVANPSRCVVTLYKKYMALRPANAPCDVFYLPPLRKPLPNCWYQPRLVGHNVLSKTVKKLTSKVGAEGYYTNH